MIIIKTNLCSFAKIVFAALILGYAVPAYSQVSGCNDSLANNYNPAANVNDGSCMYNTTAYTPPIKVDPINDTLLESSGLQMAGDFLWTFNDSGHPPDIYRIDTMTNAILQTVTLTGATNVDWEDIAFDGNYLYVGDFGNNANGARADLKIYKFALSVIPPDYAANPVVAIPSGQIEVINFTYSNQPFPPILSGANHTKFDCEAMIIDSGQIHLFSKNWIDVNTTHYVINSLAAGTYVADSVETLVTNYLVTAADKTAGQHIIALLGYQNSGTGKHFMHLLSGYSGGKYFNGNKRRLDLPDATVMGQAEGLTFRNALYGYISNEKFVRTVGPITITVLQKLRSFDISNFVTAPIAVTYTFTGNGNWSDTANWSNNNMPPAILIPGSQIIINPAAGGLCILNIPYTISKGIILTVREWKSFIINGNLTINQ